MKGNTNADDSSKNAAASAPAGSGTNSSKDGGEAEIGDGAEMDGNTDSASDANGKPDAKKDTVGGTKKGDARLVWYNTI